METTDGGNVTPQMKKRSWVTDLELYSVGIEIEIDSAKTGPSKIVLANRN